MEQGDSFSFIPFSNTNYWAKDWVEGTRIDLNTYTIPATSPVKGGDNYDKNYYQAGGTEIAVEAYAIKAARDYGAKLGGTGRLMTYEEAIAIRNDLDSNQEILSGICTGEGAFWLGSTCAHDYSEDFGVDDGSVLMEYAYVGVNGDEYNFNTGMISGFDCSVGEGDPVGVVPVVEISKSKLN